jgi:hypothetical protein
MKKLVSHTWISAWVWVVMILFFSAVLGPVARAAETDAARQYILDLINQIRMDPVGYAQELGYDGQALVAERPWLDEMLAKGLPPVFTGEYLQQKAEALNDVTGNTPLPDPPLSQDPAETGNIIGAVSFINFVDPENAVQMVINHQFEKELEHGFSGHRLILNRNLDRAGAAFMALGADEGSFRLSYQITAVMGSGITRTQRQLLNLINQIRHDPAGSTGYLSFPLADFADRQLHPLFFDEVLQAFAYTPFLTSNDYVIHAGNFGYPGFGVNRSSIIEVFPKTSADALVSWLFSALVLNEMKELTSGPVIFGPQYTDAGIHLTMVNGRSLHHVGLGVLTGISHAGSPGLGNVYGLVYTDDNANNAYTPGEGRSGARVLIHDLATREPVAAAMTDETGHFNVQLPTGRSYAFRTGDEHSPVSRGLYFQADIFLSFQVPAAPAP